VKLSRFAEGIAFNFDSSPLIVLTPPFISPNDYVKLILRLLSRNIFRSRAVLAALRFDGARMAQVQCVRCGNLGEPITEPLYLGKLETLVKGNICAACWAEWVKMRVMVINEYQV